MLMIRNLDEAVKRRLRVQAAEHGVSMEEEARVLLKEALADGARNPRNEISSQPNEWRLKASLGEILSLGCKADDNFDEKKASDDIYDYLDLA